MSRPRKAAPQVPPRSLAELMGQALTMEREAVARYNELADMMETHNNPDVGALFRKMASYEQLHVNQILADTGPDDVVVAVAGCGVCHTDLGYYYDGVRTNQPLPLALGHEISGRVVAAGARAQAWP